MGFRLCDIPHRCWFHHCLHQRCCCCIRLLLQAYLLVIHLELAPLLKFQHLLLQFKISLLGYDCNFCCHIIHQCCALLDYLCCLALLGCCHFNCYYHSSYYYNYWRWLTQGQLVGQLEILLCHHSCLLGQCPVYFLCLGRVMCLSIFPLLQFQCHLNLCHEIHWCIIYHIWHCWWFNIRVWQGRWGHRRLIHYWKVLWPASQLILVLGFIWNVFEWCAPQYRYK